MDMDEFYTEFDGWDFWSANYSNLTTLDFNKGNFQTENLLDDEKWKVILISVYVVVMVLGFIENLLILIVLLTNKKLHTITNIFISTLAISDIMLCVFNLPFQLHYGITNHWAFGPVLCRIIMPLFGIPLFASTLTILMVACERFMLIVFPLRQHMSKRLALMIMCIIIIYSICLSIPVIRYTKFEEHKLDIPTLDVHIHQAYCIEQWPSHESNRIYTIFVFFLQFVFPYSIILILYFKIYLVLKQRPLKRKETRRNYRTTRILVLISISFVLSWLPFQLFSMISYFNPNIGKTLGPTYRLTDLLLKILAMSSACINPFLYGWLNDNFRKEFSSMLGTKMKMLHMRKSGYASTCKTETEDAIRNTTII